MANGHNSADLIDALNNIANRDPKSITQKAMLSVVAEGLSQTLHNDQRVNEAVSELSTHVASLTEEVRLLADCHGTTNKTVYGDPKDPKDCGLKGNVQDLMNFKIAIVWALKIAGGALILAGMGVILAA